MNTFATALLHPQAPAPQGLRAWNGSDPARRFAVYRNNVLHSLSLALADTFPVVCQLLGEECFAATARLFITAHPPRSPILAEYGADFGDFLAGFEPLAELPWLADVARLEHARVQAFHAADAPVLPRALVQAQLARPQSLVEAVVELQPCVRILVSPWAMTSLWSAHQGHGDLAQIRTDQPEAALVLRQDDDAVVIALSLASAHFLQQLQSGTPLGVAAQTCMNQDYDDGSSFDAAASLGLLLNHPALCGWRSKE